ncbi:dipeptide epimerase [Methylocystis sp. L43]|uniref:N-acetyl-D-Glu racemase DgcA n=1 Tax=unclassified Methylocystis TaxID=2625913 RepID=UPI0018C2A382|nr:MULTISPECIES: N-acetyl-D-Glu racemase DgcA [unclassified Methylocystis]MBG0799515.1 dipeptide epimerase [Methylocystis sp. L43]MBG0807298.1 dipeptide epimerase [Methylocystis sp. H15]
MKRKLSVAIQSYPIAGSFVISRGAKTEAIVVTATLVQGGGVGRGECVPYARYGESAESVVATIESARDALEAGADRAALQRLLPAGAARNALDCALWDIEAKLSGVPAHVAAGFEALSPLVTAFTISVGAPDQMRAAAERAADRPLLKIKLAGEGDEARLAAVRAGAPDSTLIVDANESWAEETLPRQLAACADYGVSLVEQPLPAGRDDILATMSRPVPICADESVHDRASLAPLKGRYDTINVKLDKTGGLTEALALARAAQEMGFSIMAGCMVGTSLAMAPAVLVGQIASFVDLDGPLLLARDRVPGLCYEGSTLMPPAPELWG